MSAVLCSYCQLMCGDSETIACDSGNGTQFSLRSNCSSLHGGEVVGLFCRRAGIKRAAHTVCLLRCLRPTNLGLRADPYLFIKVIFH